MSDGEFTGNRRRQVLHLFKKQRGRCSLCNKEMTLKKGCANSATLEHSIPKSRMHEYPLGRPEGDMAAACYRCNQLKGSMTIDEFFVCLPQYRDALRRRFPRLLRLAAEIEAEEAACAITTTPAATAEPGPR